MRIYRTPDGIVIEKKANTAFAPASPGTACFNRTTSTVLEAARLPPPPLF